MPEPIDSIHRKSLAHDSQRWRNKRQQSARMHIGIFRQYLEAQNKADSNIYYEDDKEHTNFLLAIGYAYQQRLTDDLQALAWVLARPYGGYLSALGYWAELQDLLDRVIELSQQQGEMEIAAAFQSDLATLQFWQGSLSEATDNYRQALAILKTATPVPAVQMAMAAIYHHLGVLAQQEASYNTAEHLYQKALSLHRESENPISMARTLHQLGSLNMALGNYAKAQSFYDESLALSLTLASQTDIALTTWNLGNLAYWAGDFRLAEQQFQEALSIFDVLNDKRNRAGVLHNLSQLALDKGELTSAWTYGQQSLEIQENLGYRLELPRTLGLMAVIAYAEGKVDGAQGLFQQAIALATETGNDKERCSQVFNLVILYEQQGRLTEARHFLLEIVAIKTQLGLPELEKDREALRRIDAKLGGLMS